MFMKTDKPKMKAKKFGFGFSKPTEVKCSLLTKKSKKPSAAGLFTTNTNNQVVWPFEERDQAEGEENNEEGVISGGSLNGFNGAAALNSHKDYEANHGKTVIPLPEGASLKDDDDPDSPDEVEAEEPGQGYGPPPTLHDGLNVLRPDLVQARNKRQAYQTTAIDRQAKSPANSNGMALPAPTHSGMVANMCMTALSKTPPSSNKTKKPAFASRKKVKRRMRADDEDSLEAAAVKMLLQEVQDEHDDSSEKEEPAVIVPSEKAGLAKHVANRMIELDAAALDDDMSFGQYNRTAITGFGEAMLRGMGWKEGKGIGKTNKRLVKPYMIQRRGRRQGLGAEKLVQKWNRKRPRKPGQKQSERNPDDEEGETPKKKAKLPKSEDDKDDPPSPKQAPRKIKKKPLKWAAAGLRVRIVTKDFGKKYYKQKAIVMPIKNTYYFAVRAEENRKTLQGVTEKDVETCLPKTGGAVIILRGENKGQRGKMMAKNKKKQTASIQLQEDLTIEELAYDDICMTVAR